MKNFNVLYLDFNQKKILPYNIIPYFVKEYENLSKNKRPKSFEQFKEFIKQEGKYRFWSRCEYEFLIVPWPYKKDDPLSEATKVDIWQQIEMNLDLVTNLLIESVI